MKTLSIIILTLAIALPIIGLAANALVQGSSLSLTGGYGEVRKVYDTEEKVVCYVYDNNKAGGISCVKETV